MAVRINKAKNFKGKAYVAADELDNLIQTMTFGTALTGSSVNEWKVNFQYADQDGTATKTAVDLTAIKEYIDNKSITVTGGNGIAIDSTNLLNPTIKADVDGTTIILTGETEGSKKIAANLTLKKKGTANDGYAATYYLAYGDSTTPIGTEIDIVKDNLVKDGSLVYGTALSGNTLTNESASRVDESYKPYVKLVLNTNTDGDSTDNETVTNLYIPVNDLFDSYTAGNKAIDSTALTSNVITVVVDGTNVVYTASNTSASILSIGNSGIMVADIQGAINYAVNDEHEKASAAITSLSTGLTNLGSSTSAAVVALNTRVETVATNAQTAVNAVGDAVEALDSKVDAAIDDVNTNVETAIDTVVSNVNSAISTNVTAVNNAVSAAVDTVNEKVGSAVDNVNANVSSLADKTSAAISSVNSNVTNLKNMVSASIDNVQTAVSSFRDATSSAMTQAIDNRSTQLTNAVAVTEVVVSAEHDTFHSGWWGATINSANYILAVYDLTANSDSEGQEIYPDIERYSQNGDGTWNWGLTADFGKGPDDPSMNPVPTWGVIVANRLPALGATTMPAYTAGSNTVVYTNATNNVAYADAGKGTDAVYSNVTKTDAAFTSAVDVDYDVTAVTDKTVANGTSATAPTPSGAIAEGNLSYSGQ